MSVAVDKLVAELASSGRQVYLDGAVATLVGSGMSASEARSEITSAIDAGLFRQRGTMLQAAEAAAEGRVFDSLVHRVGRRWVVAKKRPDDKYATRDLRKGFTGEKIARTLPDLVKKGARAYSTRTRADVGAAKTYSHVAIRMAAEGKGCGCSLEAAQAIMAEERLTKAQRESLPDSAFAYVNSKQNVRLFPVYDAQHAKSAMGLLNTWYPRGHFTDQQYRSIRANILAAYDRLGLTARAPSLAKAPRMAAECSTILGVAAEPTQEQAMALTKAQRREIAMRNLAKAHAAQGRGRGVKKSKSKGRGVKAREAHYPGPGMVREPDPAKQRQAYERLAMAWAAQGRDPGPMVAKARSLGSTKAAPKVNKGGKTPKPASRPASKPAAKPARTRATAAAAPAPAAKGKKRRTARIPSGKFISPKTGTMISIRRVYPRKNPMIEFTAATAAVGGASFVTGLFVSSWVDRWIATMPPKDSTTAKIGAPGAKAINARADATRMGVQFLGTALFGIGGYLTRDYPLAMAGSVGMGLAFFTRLATQIGSSIFAPLIFKAENAQDKGFSNHYYPDLQDWAQPGATSSLVDPGIGAGSARAPQIQTVGYGGRPVGVGAPGMRGLPPAPPGLPVASVGVGAPASAADVGVGGCGVCGGGSSNVAAFNAAYRSGMRGTQSSDVCGPTCAGNCGGNCGGGCGSNKHWANGGPNGSDLPPADEPLPNGEPLPSGDEALPIPGIDESEPINEVFDRRKWSLADVIRLTARRPDRGALRFLTPSNTDTNTAAVPPTY